jgi:hypothetical protein
MLSATVVTPLISLVTSLVLGNEQGFIHCDWNSDFFNEKCRLAWLWYISFQRLNETPILTKHGTDIRPLEDVQNSYAVVSFHEIWYDMPLVNILTSPFLISYNWRKITRWQRHLTT